MTTALDLANGNQDPLRNQIGPRSSQMPIRDAAATPIPLSAFGGDMTASAYCLQAVTWYMEQGKQPSITELSKINQQIAFLMDRRLESMACTQRLTGVPGTLLTGHPSAGGFGLLAVREHIQVPTPRSPLDRYSHAASH